MLLPKILLALAAATLALAAPSTKRQEAPSFGGCGDICDQAINNLSPYCYNKTPEECRNACDLEAFLMPLYSCGTCLENDAEANNAARDLVGGWVNDMANTCNDASTSLYGGCTMCELAVSDKESRCGEDLNDENCVAVCAVSRQTHFFIAQV